MEKDLEILAYHKYRFNFKCSKRFFFRLWVFFGCLFENRVWLQIDAHGYKSGEGGSSNFAQILEMGGQIHAFGAKSQGSRLFYCIFINRFLKN